ncbi:hypothetical protein GW933_03290 [Candidatus Falkowbacteria bacterium]|uniref:Probable nicotinate-nucleotide adenylyltransferase n=1 Tax=Candidatus Buchananbacteria bacterium CG10_big_fil_rev_8_21_14_0_10_33_19 TaxID=1974525 RepID=A0A2H0W4P7_9BACT|nr:hypothetical protein [Candidatus Falkowbacteria bacterium]PIS06325.1 MAG: hypothetical protein COT80_02035 [Candidatus Buchananbacteria bacterium CG10_big_fil_rev_8_21_14_0_10_33_19]
MNKLQKQVKDIFESTFGRTPLKQRLNDILDEAIELHRMTGVANLQEEVGDLLASAIQLCNECGWDYEKNVRATLVKIQRREEQYKTLGRKLKVAILGGAFDPPTIGHIKLAQFVLNTSKTFDEVWLMPCYRHMNGKQMIDPEHRLRMCEIAARVDGRIKVFDFEIKNQLAGQTYHFVKTLLDQQMAKDQYDFSIIIGMDNANDFPTWVGYEELERMMRFVVVPRIGVKRNESVNWYLRPPHIFLTEESDVPDTASTNVREWLRHQDIMMPELDEHIFNYILAHQLYR